MKNLTLIIVSLIMFSFGLSYNLEDQINNSEKVQKTSCRYIHDLSQHDSYSSPQVNLACEPKS